MDILTKDEATNIVKDYIIHEQPPKTTQEILWDDPEKFSAPFLALQHS